MSWLMSTTAAVDPNLPNLVPPPSSGPLAGTLTAKDTSWACETSKGFVTETQSWYSALSDGGWCMFQVIFSNTGIMFVPPTVQFVFKYYNPQTKEVVWKSINITNWKASGQSGEANEVKIKHKGTPTTEETYDITASLSNELQIAVKLTKPADAPGFKVGQGEDGGMTFFGGDVKKREGFVVHRFLPVMVSSGTVILNGKAVDVAGEAMLSHAIQGMRPNLVARSWNFVFFSSPPTGENGEGRTRAIMMEFETNDEHGVAGKGKGRNKVNVGGIVVGNKLHLVTSQLHQPNTPTPAPEDKPQILSLITHNIPTVDSFTGYSPPKSVSLEWRGPSVDGKGEVSAVLSSDTGAGEVGVGGLIEKVDVLAEIPYVLRKVLSVATGTKPYIYQHFSSGTLALQLPGEEGRIVEGKVFDELTFVNA